MQRWITGACLAAILVGASACAKPAAAPRGPQSLPPDSLALLSAALKLARPAFPTQEQAIRSGVYRVGGRPAELAVSPPPSPRVSPASSPGSYVIQIGAFADLPSAERAAAEAERRFPGRTAAIEAAGTLYRVALTGWEGAGEAAAALPAVRRIYPDAWIRQRDVS